MHGHFARARKRQILEDFRKTHIYKNAKWKINLNDTHEGAYNPIFDVVWNYELGKRNYTTS
jgi:hypothetical protein